MTLRRTPLTYGDGEWAAYRPGVIDGVGTLLDTAAGVASISGVFKPTSSNYPLAANSGMAVGVIADPAAFPAAGVHPSGVAAVRVGSIWYPALAWVDTSAAGGASPTVVIQTHATGVITECSVTIGPYAAVNA